MTGTEAHLLLGLGLLIAAAVFAGIAFLCDESHDGKQAVGALLSLAAMCGGMGAIAWIKAGIMAF